MTIQWREFEAGIATQTYHPSAVSQEYLAFSNLRAFPNYQVRQLVAALVEGQLPFQNDCVHVIVKQLLFHVGESHWKTDLTSTWQGLDRIAEQIHLKVELLRQSPKDSGALVLFGIMSSFLGQYSEDCRCCARSFSEIARSWAEEVGAEVQNTERVPPELYWKQAMFYCYALLCRWFGDHEVED